MRALEVQSQRETERAEAAAQEALRAEARRLEALETARLAQEASERAAREEQEREEREREEEAARGGSGKKGGSAKKSATGRGASATTSAASKAAAAASQAAEEATAAAAAAAEAAAEAALVGPGGASAPASEPAVDPELAEVLVAQWDDLEADYTEALKRSFRENRHLRRAALEHYGNVRARLSAFLSRPSPALDEAVASFQARFNAAAPGSARTSEACRDQLHLMTADLEDTLWALCDDRRDEATALRAALISCDPDTIAAAREALGGGSGGDGDSGSDRTVCLDGLVAIPTSSDDGTVVVAGVDEDAAHVDRFAGITATAVSLSLVRVVQAEVDRFASVARLAHDHAAARLGIPPAPAGTTYTPLSSTLCVDESVDAAVQLAVAAASGGGGGGGGGGKGSDKKRSGASASSGKPKAGGGKKKGGDSKRSAGASSGGAEALGELCTLDYPPADAETIDAAAATARLVGAVGTAGTFLDTLTIDPEAAGGDGTGAAGAKGKGGSSSKENRGGGKKASAAANKGGRADGAMMTGEIAEAMEADVADATAEAAERARAVADAERDGAALRIASVRREGEATVRWLAREAAGFAQASARCVRESWRAEAAAVACVVKMARTACERGELLPGRIVVTRRTGASASGTASASASASAGVPVDGSAAPIAVEVREGELVVDVEMGAPAVSGPGGGGGGGAGPAASASAAAAAAAAAPHQVLAQSLSSQHSTSSHGGRPVGERLSEWSFSHGQVLATARALAALSDPATSTLPTASLAGALAQLAGTPMGASCLPPGWLRAPTRVLEQVARSLDPGSTGFVDYRSFVVAAATSSRPKMIPTLPEVSAARTWLERHSERRGVVPVEVALEAPFWWCDRADAELLLRCFARGGPLTAADPLADRVVDYVDLLLHLCVAPSGAEDGMQRAFAVVGRPGVRGAEVDLDGVCHVIRARSGVKTSAARDDALLRAFETLRYDPAEHAPFDALWGQVLAREPWGAEAFARADVVKMLQNY
jgi:hypothetical protein